MVFCVFFFKQKTAYEMRISDWSSDVCSSDLHIGTVALEQMLAAGCELVVNDLGKGVSPLDRIVETEASYVMGVPTHAIDILGEEIGRASCRERVCQYV